MILTCGSIAAMQGGKHHGEANIACSHDPHDMDRFVEQ